MCHSVVAAVVATPRAARGRSRPCALRRLFLPDSQHQGPWFGSESFEALVSVPHRPAGAPWLHGHADAAVGYCELDPVASVVTAVRQGDCVGCNCNVSLIG
jgi:hypothetical protein